MRIPLAYIATVLIWGSTWYAIELQLGVVSPDWSVAYRFFFSAALLFGFCAIRKESLSFPLKRHRQMMQLGFLLFGLNYFLIYIGTGYLTSGLVAVVFSMLTFFNIFNSRLFLKIPIETKVIIASVSGFAGLILIFWPEVKEISLEDQTTVGILICLAATLSASLGNTTAATPKVREIPLFPLTAWGMLYGALFTSVVALAQGNMPSLDMSFDYIWSFMYLSVFGSVVAFSLYFWLIEEIGVNRAAYSSVMIPIVALIISTFLEGYVWTVPSVSGVALVIFGNLMLIKKSKQKFPLKSR